VEIQRYSPAERAQEKQASREEDRRALENGEKSPDDIRQENAHFAFPRSRIDFSSMLALV
jgi:hypothetical protein